MSTVQLQGFAPSTAIYQAAQPLGAVQLQLTPYQTGMWPMWQNIDLQSDAYLGIILPLPPSFVQL